MMKISELVSCALGGSIALAIFYSWPCHVCALFGRITAHDFDKALAPALLKLKLESVGCHHSGRSLPQITNAAPKATVDIRLIASKTLK